MLCKFRRRLRLEPLEDRRLLATYTVDSLSDITANDGMTTLREALALANANGNADTIQFAPSLFGLEPEVLLLTEGVLHVDEETTIIGPSAELLTIDASGNDSTPEVVDGQGTGVFYVRDSGFFDRQVTISGLTLSGGDANTRGGAIWAEDPLRLEDMVLVDNNASQNGGGIYAESRLELVRTKVERCTSAAFGGGIYSLDWLTMTHSTITDNQSTFEGGGIYIRDTLLSIDASEISHNRTIAATLDGGGGVFAWGVWSTVDNSRIVSNSSNFNGGGYALREGQLTLRSSTVKENMAPMGFGGGVYSNQATNLTIKDSSVKDNSAMVEGGGVYSNFTNSLNVIDSIVEGNHAGSQGGGVYARNTFSVRVIDCRVVGNSAESRGGGLMIDRDSGLFVENSTLYSNDAGNVGGAIAVVDATNSILTSTFTHNSADVGGAIYGQTTDLLRVRSSTFSGNRARDSGGAIASSGPRISASYSTFTANRADSDDDGTGEGGALFAYSGTEISLGHSIVAGNTDAGNAPDIRVFMFNGQNLPPFVPQFSLIGSNQGTPRAEAPLGSPDILGNFLGGPNHGLIDPMLSPLSDNGGPTQTHAPLPGSPVIDAGNTTVQAGVDFAPDYDQRGNNFGRVQNGRIDIGAIEVQEAHSADFDGDGYVNGADFLAWQRGYRLAVPSATKADGDADNDLDVDANDVAIWNDQFGTVPLVTAVISFIELPSTEWETERDALPVLPGAILELAMHVPENRVSHGGAAYATAPDDRPPSTTLRASTSDLPRWRAEFDEAFSEW